MPDPTATPIPPGGGWPDPGGGGGTSGPGGRGPVTGSTMVDGWAHWVYADGSTSPKSGAQQTAGGGGDRATGQVIKLPDGSTWQVNAPKQPILSALSDTPSGGPPTQTVTNTQTGQTLQLPPGQYELVSGEHVFITPGGILLEAEAPDGAGSAPDVVGTANAWMNYYELQVRNGLMPREQAESDWDRKYDELNAVIDVEISQGTFEQTAAVETNRAQAQFEANQLRQQEEFGRRSESMVQDFLPNFMPGLTGANIPGVTGTMPVPQVNPDQIYGLGALAGATPTAPVPIPNPQITPFDPSQLPQVPNYTPPPLPNILGLLGLA